MSSSSGNAALVLSSQYIAPLQYWMRPLLFVLMAMNALGQNGNFRVKQLEIMGKSPLPPIDCIYQDRSGFLWIGTANGLYKYDGYSTIHYHHDPSDSLSLGDNKIRCLLEDKNGNMWIGTQVGLHFLDTKTGRFKNNVGKSNGILGVVDVLKEDKDGNILASSMSGLMRIDR